MTTDTMTAPPQYQPDLLGPLDIVHTLKTRMASNDRPCTHEEAVHRYTTACERLNITGHRIGSALLFTGRESEAIIAEAAALLQSA